MSDSHLFAGSPFTLTATPQAAKVWCARPDGLKRVRRIIAGIRADSNSALELIWANFGSGKTHVLYFISNQLQTNGVRAAVSYVELSERVRSFMDLYKLIVGGLDLDLLFADVNPTKLEGIDGNLMKMVSLRKFGNQEERELSSRWIRAEKVDLRELRRLSNVTVRIEDERQALDILRGLISLSALCDKPVVLLIDEFQRMAVIPERARASVMSAIRTLFNQNPSGLTVVVAVTSGVEQTAMALLPQELKTILGPRPTISLPEMSKDEAIEFCKERLAAYRPVGYVGDEFGPFGAEPTQAMVGIMAEEASVRLTPRNIIHALAWLYEDYIVNARTSYSADEVVTAMRELSWGGLQ
jgi:hypothetical protein